MGSTKQQWNRNRDEHLYIAWKFHYIHSPRKSRREIDKNFKDDLGDREYQKFIWSVGANKVIIGQVEIANQIDQARKEKDEDEYNT